MICYAFFLVGLSTICVRLAPLALCLAILSVSGCSKPTANKLVDPLKTINGNRIVAIEQLDLTTRDGRPSAQAVQSAKVIKHVQLQMQVEAFAKALSAVSEGARFANHPVAIGDMVLRVETIDGTWFIFCRVMQTAAGKTCTLNIGQAGETNINRMKEYESDTLPAWFSEHQIEPK